MGMDDDACDLLLRLLSADPAARPTARQVRPLHAATALGILPCAAGPCAACNTHPEPASRPQRLLSQQPFPCSSHATRSLQVLSHPWLAEVEGLIPSPGKATPPAAAPPAAPEAVPPTLQVSPGFESRLRAAASDLACLGFSPATPGEDAEGEGMGLNRCARPGCCVFKGRAQGAAGRVIPTRPGGRRAGLILPVPRASHAPCRLHNAYPPPLLPRLCRRRSSGLSAASADSHYELPPGDRSGATSAYASCASLAELPAGCRPAGEAPAAAAAAAEEPCSFVLADGTALSLLPRQVAAALVAAGLLPDLSSSGGGSGGGLPYRALGFAVQPVEVAVEGRRLQVSAIHAVYDVQGQPMLHAEVRRSSRRPQPPATLCRSVPGCHA